VLRRLRSSSLPDRLLRWTAPALLALAGATGCSTIDYYAQAVRGHFAVQSAARSIDELLADPATPEALRERLRRAREIRAFAARELGLPDNASYTTYADLHRPAVVWNVFATPALSLELKTWCYPLFGCAGYRGYFDRNDADRLAVELRAQGWDVNVAPVPAYSTLGWFADPLLNTFINAQDGELARMVFHELAHQVVYAKDDTVFNESFATTVERAGVARWLAARRDEALSRGYAQIERRRRDFLALLLKYRERLQRIYAEPASRSVLLERKRETFAALQAEYRQLRDGPWGGFAGYDRYFAQDLNNAHLAAIGAYYELVPAFEALLARDGSLPAFYADVRRLARLDKTARDQTLGAVLSGETSR
jgi:predicted aminopeptidase